MKIINLQASNFKRLKAVTITPTGSIVTITGKNGQGKSSVLDSIWATFGGTEALPKVPVREGASEAIIRLDLGEYVVTRKIKAKDGGEFTTSLTIETPDGVKAKSPQTLLNELVGRFSLDPLEFSRLSPKGQYDALKHLVPGLDLDDIKIKNDADYERRTAANRKAKEAKAAAASIGAKDGKVGRVDTTQITDDIARASDHNKSIADRVARREAAAEFVSDMEKLVESDKFVIEEFRNKIAELEERIARHAAGAADLRRKLAAAPALEAPLDTAELATALAGANAANAEAEKQERRDAFLADVQKYEAEADALTEAMEAREQHKVAAIAAAKFPLPGLSLGNEEVLVEGLPFDQAATSQKIRTSVALAMAMNPTIRVIRIMDGSLLDSDAMKVVADMAKDSDFQIWVETVSDGTGSGIIIEDGHIKE